MEEEKNGEDEQEWLLVQEGRDAPPRGEAVDPYGARTHHHDILRCSRRNRMTINGVLFTLCVVVIFLALDLFTVLRTSVRVKGGVVKGLCSRDLVAVLDLEMRNPSSCEPFIYPFNATFFVDDIPMVLASSTAIRVVHGRSTLFSPLNVSVLSPPNLIYDLVMNRSRIRWHVEGEIPVRIRCLVLPFTVNFQVATLAPFLSGSFSRNTSMTSSFFSLLHDYFGDSVSSKNLRLSPAPDNTFPLTSLLPHIPLVSRLWVLAESLLSKAEVEGRADGEQDKIVGDEAPGGDFVKDAIRQIIKTIAMRQVKVEDHGSYIRARTNITFDYGSSLALHIPRLSLEAGAEGETKREERLAVVTVDPMLLGGGPTVLVAQSDLPKDSMRPLESVLLRFLKGEDVELKFHGSGICPRVERENREFGEAHFISTISRQDTEQRSIHLPWHYTEGTRDAGEREDGEGCFFQELMDCMVVHQRLPGSVDGHPLLLRNVTVVKKVIDFSLKKKKCILVLGVQLLLHNPLPVQIDVQALHFNASFSNASREGDEHPLGHVALPLPLRWHPHQTEEVQLNTTLRSYEGCLALVSLYSAGELAFNVRDGHVKVGVAGSLYDIPFSFKGIKIANDSFLSPESSLMPGPTVSGSALYFL